MALLGNIIWFLFGGWALFLIYLLGAVFFFPMFIPLFRLAQYAAWPFGRTVLSQRELSRYRQTKEIDDQVSAMTTGLRATSSIMNLLWMLTFGWLLAIAHFFGSIINLMFFWLIVTIPNIGGHWKMMGVALMPFNKVIVPATVAQEVKDTNARKKLNLQ